MRIPPQECRRRRLLAALAGVLLLAAPALAQTGRSHASLKAVRFWSLGDVTRIAIETSAEVRYQWQRIENPDRLFFDLDGIRRRPGTRGVEVLPVGDKLVEQIRIAETQPGVVRIVLDLRGAVEFQTSQLANPDRLMIEVRPAAAAPVPPVRSITGGRELSEAPPAAGTPVAPPVKPPAQPEAAKPAIQAPPIASAPKPASAKEAAKEPAKEEAPDAAAARRNSRGEQSLIRALGLKLERIVLDPGHGGHDTGTIGPGGLAEKDLVLDVAKRLGALIAERLGSEVIFTRSDDTFIPLHDRTALARDKRADLFLSIHANSSRARTVAGSETYYLSLTGASDELDVAARENATSDKSIFELQDMVQKIARTQKVQESREFASTMQKALQTGLWRGRVRDRGVKKAPFVVLIGADVPSVLAEIDFLSNPREERLLKRPDHRQKVADALFKGVSDYAATLSHYQLANK